MDAQEELRRERRDLAKAQADVLEGEQRVLRQERLLSSLRAAGRPSQDAEALARVLAETLALWRAHREQILRRIDYLTALASERNRGAAAPGAHDRRLMDAANKG